MRFAGTRLDFDDEVVESDLMRFCRCAMRAVLAGSWASSTVRAETVGPPWELESCTRSSWLSIRRTWLECCQLAAQDMNYV